MEIESYSDDQRGAYRLPTDRQNGLETVFLGKKVLLYDISAGGISFDNKGFNIDDQDRIDLDLNLCGLKPIPILSFTAKIITIDDRNLCHLVFQDITREQEEIIHQYILLRQKAWIKRNKAMKQDDYPR
ncbi:MAG: PilZ domain-containing protein [Desulfobacteraceae bacterium]